MSILAANETQLIVFTILDAAGAEVIGLGSGFTLQLSKNGGAFASSGGVKAEIGSGWYSYELTATETDTAGPLAVKVTGAGADQLNLLYEIRPYSAAEPAGATILTAAEGANVLRCLTTDALMLQLLPLVDDYIEMATGRDWAADTTINPMAKSAAQMLLVMWHENPAMIGNQGALSFGLAACLTQLEAQALILATSGVPDEALALAASMPADGDDHVAITANLTLIFNHLMSAGATTSVTLKTLAGSTVTTTNTLDVTGKILTVNPDSNLTAASDYQIVIAAAADEYGQTLTKTIGFRTA